MMNKGMHDAAKISAENVIRLKGEALSCRKMAAQLAALAMKLDSAERISNIEKMGIEKEVKDFE